MRIMAGETFALLERKMYLASFKAFFEFDMAAITEIGNFFLKLSLCISRTAPDQEKQHRA
jgi:hypothetical protein